MFLNAKANPAKGVLHPEKAAGIWALAVIFLILVSFLLPGFFTAMNIGNLISRSLPLFFVAVGQMFVLLTGGIDLSVGSIISLSSCLASVTMEWNLPLSICICLLCGGLLGFISGVGVSKFRINPFIVTLGASSIAGGFALLIRPAPGGVIDYRFASFVTGTIFGIPVFGISAMILISVLTYYILHRTVLGLRIYAVGGNEHNCRLAGINATAIKLFVYTLSGVMAAVGGLCVAARMYCGDAICGEPFLLDSIAVVVLGGTSLTGGRGGILGTLAGLIIMAPLSNILNLLGVTAYYQYVIKGLLLVAIVSASNWRALGKVNLRLLAMGRR